MSGDWRKDPDFGAWESELGDAVREVLAAELAQSTGRGRFSYLTLWFLNAINDPEFSAQLQAEKLKVLAELAKRWRA
jgi:hypothetical protein